METLHAVANIKKMLNNPFVKFGGVEACEQNSVILRKNNTGILGIQETF